MISVKGDKWWWGPIDGRPVYPDAWYVGLTANKKLMPPGWPESFSLYKGERYSYICDRADLDRRATAAFNKYIMQNRKFASWQRVWKKVVQKFVKMNSNILNQNLSSLSNHELFKLINDWYQHYSRKFWGVGLLPELANLGGEVLLLKTVQQTLSLKHNYMTIIEKLSAPERLSFYQQEERDLLQLRLLKKQTVLKKRLLAHQIKYYWLFNSYHSSRVLSLDYFQKRLLSKKPAQAKVKLHQIDAQIREATHLKSLLIKKNKLGGVVLKISRRLSYCIWWQDYRKAFIFQANHTIDVVLRELAKRFKISFADLHWYTFNEILRLAKNGMRLSRAEVKARRRYFVVYWRPQAVTRYLSGDAAKKVYDKFSLTINRHKVNELRGLSVSAGKARGKVRVILSARQAGRIRRGEILVTTMTSPEFIVAMRKAAGVITDVGGLTSHAAIVSRELKIPCIVSTKIATKVFKTGDNVEIDADNGTIRVI